MSPSPSSSHCRRGKLDRRQPGFIPRECGGAGGGIAGTFTAQAEPVSSRDMTGVHDDAPGGNRMDLGLNGRVALVAAASRGLGKAVATALAEEGARVAIFSRQQAAIEAAAAEVRSR